MLTLECCSFSLQRVLSLKTLDGILNPAPVIGKDIVVNIYNVNKTGIVVLENKAGMMLDDSFFIWLKCTVLFTVMVIKEPYFCVSRGLAILGDLCNEMPGKL